MTFSWTVKNETENFKNICFKFPYCHHVLSRRNVLCSFRYQKFWYLAVVDYPLVKQESLIILDHRPSKPSRYGLNLHFNAYGQKLFLNFFNGKMLIEFHYKTSTSCRRKRLRQFWWTQTSPRYKQTQRVRSNRTRFISCRLHPSLWRMWSNERNQTEYCCPWVDKLHLMSASFNSTKNFLSILTPTILIHSLKKIKICSHLRILTLCW